MKTAVVKVLMIASVLSPVAAFAAQAGNTAPATATYIMKEDIDKVGATEQSASTRDLQYSQQTNKSLSSSRSGIVPVQHHRGVNIPDHLVLTPAPVEVLPAASLQDYGRFLSMQSCLTF